MADIAQTTGPGVAPTPSTLAPVSTDTFPVGSACCLNSDGEVLRAQADAENTSRVCGLALTQGISQERTIVQYGDVLKLTLAQWGAITDDPGLTPNTYYYLRASLAGKLTTTPPSGEGEFVALVGLGISPTELLIQIEAPYAAS